MFYKPSQPQLDAQSISYKRKEKENLVSKRLQFR